MPNNNRLKYEAIEKIMNSPSRWVSKEVYPRVKDKKKINQNAQTLAGNKSRAAARDTPEVVACDRYSRQNITRILSARYLTSLSVKQQNPSY